MYFYTMHVFLIICKGQAVASDANSAEFWTAVFTGLLTFATIALFWVGYAQLRGIKKPPEQTLYLSLPPGFLIR
jgi:hypothetical protein